LTHAAYTAAAHSCTFSASWPQLRLDAEVLRTNARFADRLI
jgi:hypothetical protein